MNIAGIIARSTSLPAVSCEASLVKTMMVRELVKAFWLGKSQGQDLLKHGVKSATFRLAVNFCISAVNMP